MVSLSMKELLRQDIDRLVREGHTKEEIEKMVQDVKGNRDHHPGCGCEEKLKLVMELIAERFATLLQEDEIEKLYQEKIASNG